MANMLMTRFCMYIKDCQFEKSTLDLCRDNRNCNRSKILCSTSRGNRGFGPRPLKKEKTNKVLVPKDDAGLGPQTRKSTTDMSDTKPNEAPDLIGQLDGKSGNNVLDRQFEERLEAVRRSAFEQKKVDDSKQYGPIDYDTPVDSNQSTIGLGTKIGVGVAVVVFGLVFAFGDFLPSISVDPADEAPIVDKNLTDEEKSTYQTRLQQLEAKLSISPEDPDALEGAAVTLSELGEYGRAASLLENLAKKKARDPDVYRLLGEVKYLLKDYEGSATAYRSSASVSESFNLEVLRGLTNSLLAAKKPDEAVQVLLDFRQRLNTENSNSRYVDAAATTSNLAMDTQKIDPIQVELLLGKAYSDWGHVSDAVAVYDQLISKYPNDFRGYLAKGIILKENGKVGDAERMFIQARFFAPEKAKILVDRYSKK